MKTLEQFFEDCSVNEDYVCDTSKFSNDNYKENPKQNVKGAYSAFNQKFFELSNGKKIEQSDTINLKVEFFKPGSCWRNPHQRDEVYETLAEKYGEMPAFVYLHTIYIPKEERKQNEKQAKKGIDRDLLRNGTSIIKTIISKADRYGIPLLCHASAYFAPKKQQEEYIDKLVAYYKKFGFKEIEDWWELPDELDGMGGDGEVVTMDYDIPMWYLPKPLA